MTFEHETVEKFFAKINERKAEEKNRVMARKTASHGSFQCASGEHGKQCERENRARTEDKSA